MFLENGDSALFFLLKIGRCPHFPSTGRPAGDETFATRLEELLGRTLRPKAIGIPRK